MIHSFKIENDVLEMDIYEISKYPLIAAIYNRDITSTKDIARKELMYIHFIADKNGYCVKSGLSTKLAHEYARDNSQLPKNYKADDAVHKAIQFVKDNLQITVVEDLIYSTIKGLNLSGRVVKHITDSMEDILDNKDFDPKELIDIDINLKALIKLTSEIPSRVESLNNLMITWRKQETGTDTIRGGSNYETSYDGEGEGTITNSEALHIED